MSHYIYLVRHGEQRDAEHGIDDGPLSARGAAQAHAIGRRLANVPFSAAYTSPLDRAAQTADIMSSYLQGPKPEPTSLLFDCVPSGRTDETPDYYDSYYSGVSQAAVEAGAAQMEDATVAYLTRERDRKHTLLVTHNSVIGWLVREALEAPSWRWLALQTGNAALTILRVRRSRPSELLVHNDQGHLPPELRTGCNWDLPI